LDKAKDAILSEEEKKKRRKLQKVGVQITVGVIFLFCF